MSMLEKAVSAGVKIAAGTDAGTNYNFHGLNAMEIILYVRSGIMTPLSAIHAGTLQAASALGIDKETGSLVKGKQADIVVVDGLLQDNLEALIDGINMVFKSGERVADNEHTKGIACVLSAYILWGILPMYWKMLQDVPALEILAHRIVWSLVFLIALMAVTGKLKACCIEVNELIHQPRKMLGIFISAIILNINWGTYIWAVNHNYIIQTSLGYYINPLISVLLGIIFLKERLSLWQLTAFFLAAAGVLSLTVQYGTFPWIAITLAMSFGFYGLFKKLINTGAITGLTLETLLSIVFALAYLIFVHNTGDSAFHFSLSSTTKLLIGAGVVTATPLILFAAGATRLPLFAVGFLQYIAPTIALFLGIFVYHENFTAGHLLSFTVIWAGLLVFTLSRTRVMLTWEEKIFKKAGLDIRKAANQ